MPKERKLIHRPLVDEGFKSTFKDTVDKLEITRNAVAVAAQVRPITINELYSGQSKQLNFTTLAKILKALDELSIEHGKPKIHTISDIIERDC